MDQSMGFFGYSAQQSGPSQPRYFAVIDVAEAVEASREYVEAVEVSRLTAAPLYSGGVLDCWPAHVVDALAVARVELSWIEAHEAAQQRQRAPARG